MEPIYIYCCVLLLSFLAMDVVAHALFRYYCKVKNFHRKAVVMKPVLGYYKNATLFHFRELNSECIELCLSLFSIILFSFFQKSCHSFNTSLQPNCNVHTWYAK